MNQRYEIKVDGAHASRCLNLNELRDKSRLTRPIYRPWFYYFVHVNM
ncbi:unnamed protein product [Spirodela intermedia]|uniref:Uncharacterized protein n=1 Tax=Spirodela intermedia TaxID=51605 RepID=A0A7I8ICU1_SPIIN|nr:unnamed protein product [Spirodela intermedia]CAA6655590.1 unnamed protein product [Spirodela intermedia]